MLVRLANSQSLTWIPGLCIDKDPKDNLWFGSELPQQMLLFNKHFSGRSLDCPLNESKSETLS